MRLVATRIGLLPPSVTLSPSLLSLDGAIGILKYQVTIPLTVPKSNENSKNQRKFARKTPLIWA